jgi:hypothetical protein
MIYIIFKVNLHKYVTTYSQLNKQKSLNGIKINDEKIFLQYY